MSVVCNTAPDTVHPTSTHTLSTQCDCVHEVQVTSVYNRKTEVSVETVKQVKHLMHPMLFFLLSEMTKEKLKPKKENLGYRSFQTPGY